MTAPATTVRTGLDVAWVALLGAVALAVAAVAGAVDTDPTRTVSGAGIVADVPAGWLADGRDPGLVLSDGIGSPATMTITAAVDETGPESAAFLAAQEHARQLTLYRLSTEAEVEVGGEPGYRITYSFVNPVPDPPIVLIGADVFWRSGDRLFTASLTAPEDGFVERYAEFAAVLDTVAVEGS